MLQLDKLFACDRDSNLVEEVVPKPSSTEDTLVCLSCLEDDAIGESLSVLWEREEDAQMEAATKEAAGDGQSARELEILESMADVANHARHQQDPRIKKLVEWIRTNLCPDLGKPNAAWLERRVIIFTEYTNTKRYLQQQLQAAIASSNREHERIDVFHGGIGEERREAIKNAFNAEPSRHPLRILIATDAAREGINLQNHCADLFHFDVPWNPSRMEQRNGRIDRKLQRSPIVRCYYVILPQRTEDRVLDVLVKKTNTIQQELGSLAPVVERNVSRLLLNGIRHEEVNRIADSINQADTKTGNALVISEELEEARLRQQDLTKQIQQLQEMLKTSRNWLGLDEVLEALWELLRGFQTADEATHGRLLSDITQTNSQYIYGGMITILLLLVFLLYAEDRGLMPQDTVYTCNYSVSGLYERLREDAGNYPDTMDQRYGAWT